MTIHRASYLKTLLLVALLAVFLLVVGIGASFLTESKALLAIAIGAVLPMVVVMVAGCVVLYRDSRLATGAPDVFLSLNRSRNEAALADNRQIPGTVWRRAIRHLSRSRQLLVGDRVRIRPFEEIARTLDASDSLDGLPFMPEMVRFCGSQARVYRRLDKIYDYGGKRDMRRLRNAVLLQGMRCDGSAHDGCQAGCLMIWQEAWLERDSVTVDANQTAGLAATPRALQPQFARDVSGKPRYQCQFTNLVAASTRLAARDWRQDLRPILAGNLSIASALVAWLTRLFNRVQHWRGGMGFPSMPQGTSGATPVVTLDLKVGDRVLVRPIEEIAGTLDKNGKNRGLWFDADMVKHCRQEYRVVRRVDRIIDDATGLMRQMKTPCIVLGGANASGEGLRFCFQEDPLFWREVWLQPAGRESVGASESALPPPSGERQEG